MTSTATPFEQIGGAPAVSAAVDLFYEKVWGDPALAPYFEGIDGDRLKSHQRTFLTSALGGPNDYVGRTIGAAHSGLGITPEAFDRVVGHLVATLTDLGVDPELIQAVGQTLAPLQPEIVEAEAA